MIFIYGPIQYMCPVYNRPSLNGLPPSRPSAVRIQTPGRTISYNNSLPIFIYDLPLSALFVGNLYMPHFPVLYSHLLPTVPYLLQVIIYKIAVTGWLLVKCTPAISLQNLPARSSWHWLRADGWLLLWCTPASSTIPLPAPRSGTPAAPCG